MQTTAKSLYHKLSIDPEPNRKISMESFWHISTHQPQSHKHNIESPDALIKPVFGTREITIYSSHPSQQPIELQLLFSTVLINPLAYRYECAHVLIINTLLLGPVLILYAEAMPIKSSKVVSSYLLFETRRASPVLATWSEPKCCAGLTLSPSAAES